MSTPNTTNPPTQPSSASKKGAGYVSTNTASPAPRSVPSPAATRKDQSGKTPVNHPTAGSSHGSKTLASTPMVASLSQTGISSSPGQHFGTPSALHGLGVDLGSATPNLNVPTPMLAAAGMMPSMSEIMGVGTSRKRNEDEERKARMNKILRKIGKPKGRVTRDGIMRIARRCGLTPEPDANEISMAGVGEKMILVVKMQGEMVESVSSDIFICESEKKSEDQYMGIAASTVLLQDLTVPNGILLQSKLDRFATSLDRLAKLDRLSKGQVDCFEALNGIYTSLKKLYELEKEAVKTLNDLKGTDADEKAAREVLRKRSGRPSIHANGKIGMSLDYWTSYPHTASVKDNSAMDIDSTDSAQPPTDGGSDVWSLRIEAQSCAAGMYPSLRVSDAWLPETYEVVPPESNQILPWQDPPPTFVSAGAADASDAMAIDGQRLPDLRYVAKLDPPVKLPLQIAATILATLGDQYSQSTMFPIYHFNLLGIKSQDMSVKVVSEQSVAVLREGDETEAQHEYILDVSKGDLGYTLEEVPFSHPRQLVELLPTLRQWASIGTLLQDAFSSPRTTNSLELATNGVNGMKLANGNGSHSSNGMVSLDDILDSTSDGDSTRLRVDMAFASNSTMQMPIPNISLVYSDPAGTEVSSIAVQILPNANIAIETFDGIDVSAAAPTPQADNQQSEDDLLVQAKKAKLAKALELSGDLGIWIEWMRAQSRS
ncbi:putative mediator complex, subunit Med1 [Septoria linicola]|nr:putative mediator complex, subunit Med1 [Septoria linicola]